VTLADKPLKLIVGWCLGLRIDCGNSSFCCRNWNV